MRNFNLNKLSPRQIIIGAVASIFLLSDASFANCPYLQEGLIEKQKEYKALLNKHIDHIQNLYATEAACKKKGHNTAAKAAAIASGMGFNAQAEVADLQGEIKVNAERCSTVFNEVEDAQVKLWDVYKISKLDVDQALDFMGESKILQKFCGPEIKAAIKMGRNYVDTQKSMITSIQRNRGNIKEYDSLATKSGLVSTHAALLAQNGGDASVASLGQKTIAASQGVQASGQRSNRSEIVDGAAGNEKPKVQNAKQETASSEIKEVGNRGVSSLKKSESDVTAAGATQPLKVPNAQGTNGLKGLAKEMILAQSGENAQAVEVARLPVVGSEVNAAEIPSAQIASQKVNGIEVESTQVNNDRAPVSEIQTGTTAIAAISNASEVLNVEVSLSAMPDIIEKSKVSMGNESVTQNAEVRTAEALSENELVAEEKDLFQQVGKRIKKFEKDSGADQTDRQHGLVAVRVF